jgi:hypothetical protein
LPHCLAFDSKGRLLVGDRNKNRIQVFDQDGNFIEQSMQFSRPSGIAVGKDDVIYAEGVAVDSNGVIYGAEVVPNDLKRYVKK